MADPFPLPLDQAVALARELVAERWPEAVAAWLGGSVAAGRATATSDLDILVLLDGPPAPFRESMRRAEVPIELFVHTVDSVRHYVAKDRARRQPTMARLVASGVLLTDRDGRAGALVRACANDLAVGPDPLPPNEIDALRYAVTDLCDDLLGATDERERAAVAAALWEAAARLLLGVDRHWQGTGKGLHRALSDRDGAVADSRGADLTAGLVTAATDPGRLAEAVRAVLAHAGGRLFEGYRLGGEPG